MFGSNWVWRPCITFSILHLVAVQPFRPNIFSDWFTNWLWWYQRRLFSQILVFSSKKCSVCFLENYLSKQFVPGTSLEATSFLVWYWPNFSAIAYIAVRIYVMFDYMNHNIGFFQWKHLMLWFMFMLNIPNLQRVKLDYFMFHFMLCLW